MLVCTICHLKNQNKGATSKCSSTSIWRACRLSDEININPIPPPAGVPLAMTSTFAHRWLWGSLGCDIEAFIVYFLGVTSMYILLAISIDRYIAITKPILGSRISKKWAALSCGEYSSLRVIGSLGHWVIGSLSHWVIGLLGHWVIWS